MTERAPNQEVFEGVDPRLAKRFGLTEQERLTAKELVPNLTMEQTDETEAPLSEFLVSQPEQRASAAR